MRRYSIATAISKMMGKGRMAEELRRIYHKTFTYKRFYKDLIRGEILLKRHKIQIRVSSDNYGIEEVFGESENPKYKFVLDDTLIDEIAPSWEVTTCNKYLKGNERLLAWELIKCVGYITQIREIFEERVYDLPGEHFVTFDVGANVGVYTVKKAVDERIKGNNTIIYAIEPDPFTVNVLRKNIYENELEGCVEVIKKAVWSKPGRLKFCRYLISHSANGVLELKKDHLGEFLEGPLKLKEIVEVEADTLDNIVEELGLDRVDLIKMDIERAEVEALKGSTKVLMKYKPKLVIAAYHRIPPEYKRSYKILSPMLRKKGYKVTLHRVCQKQKVPEISEVFIHAIKA